MSKYLGSGSVCGNQDTHDVLNTYKRVHSLRKPGYTWQTQPDPILAHSRAIAHSSFIRTQYPNALKTNTLEIHTIVHTFKVHTVVHNAYIRSQHMHYNRHTWKCISSGLVLILLVRYMCTSAPSLLHLPPLFFLIPSLVSITSPFPPSIASPPPPSLCPYDYPSNLVLVRIYVKEVVQLGSYSETLILHFFIL